MTTAGYAGVLAGPAAMGFACRGIGGAQSLLGVCDVTLPRAADRASHCVAGGSRDEQLQRSASAFGKALQPREGQKWVGISRTGQDGKPKLELSHFRFGSRRGLRGSSLRMTLRRDRG